MLVDIIVVEKGRTRLLAKDIIGPIVVFDGPKHPGYLRECARVECSGLLLLHYNLVRDGKPFNLARVINTEGAVVLERELYRGDQFSVRHGGKTYRVRIPEPDWPG